MKMAVKITVLMVCQIQQLNAHKILNSCYFLDVELLHPEILLTGSLPELEETILPFPYGTKSGNMIGGSREMANFLTGM